MSAQEHLHLLARIEELESENRRVKGVALVCVAVVVLILAMGQAGRNQTVEAQEFVLKDMQGKTRAKLGIVSDNALLTLYGIQGGKEKGIAVEVGAGPAGPFILLLDSRMATRAKLELDGDMPLLRLYNAAGEMTILLAATKADGGPVLLLAQGGSNAIISALNGHPAIQVADKEGFRAVIGSTDLVTTKTGETHQTSAASLVLFGKDGKVLWSAP